MSLGGPFNTTVNDLVGDLHAIGILSVVASGNDGSNTCSTASPSSALLAITVNASTLFDGQDDDAQFSNFGPCTDIYAPGVEIYSAGHLSDNSYLELDGTSMASPLVAGVVASILEANPNESSDIISQKLLNSALPVDFLPDTSDAKKFLQFGPTLSGYFPQPAESVLGFFGPGNIHATWRHPQVADESILPVEKLGVEILTLPSSESPVIGACSVEASLTECTIEVSTVATSYYLRTTTETQEYLQQSLNIVEIDDYREQQKDGPWVELSVGGVTACGIDIFQDLYCWGDSVNSSTGLISPSSESDRSFVPVRVPSIGKVKFVEVAPSDSVCAITSSDRLYCWGSNLGNMVDNTNNHVSSPRDMGISNIKRVVLGNNGRACAIDLSDSLYCWGQFLGVSGNLSNPTLISTSIADVSIGSVAYCRVGLNSTQVTCAGSNNRGQLGDGTLTSSSGGTSVVGLSGTIVKLESSDDVTCALNSTAILQCWGWNDGSPDPLLASNTPRRALLISTDVEHVSLDFSSLCITQESTGRIACTGRTSHLASGLQVTGLEGNASFTYLSPTAPDSASHELGSGTICSLTIQGRILCQGSGSFGIISAGSRVTENSLSQVARVPFPVEVTKPLSNSRLQGVNRYGTAIQISQAAFPESGVSKVFISSGLNFPDALSAGPVAAALGAPLLLTNPEFLIEALMLELARLSPSELIILGSVLTVSQFVEDELERAGYNVTRISGINRYETAVLTSRLVFQTADTVIVAAGENFPDALAGSAAAIKISSPLLLVRGKSSAIDPSVASYLSDLGPSKIYVLGGPNVVSDEVLTALQVYGDVERIAGVHRVDTSVQIAKRFFSSAQSGIVTFGWNFPDALAGSMLASNLGIPIYTSRQDCVHKVVIHDFRRLGVNQFYVLGSEATLSGRVAQLSPCD
jgi:putative cell wall-binding protein/alpha-tubulin suppressor-like RCC1 family protein